MASNTGLLAGQSHSGFILKLGNDSWPPRFTLTHGSSMALLMASWWQRRFLRPGCSWTPSPSPATTVRRSTISNAPCFRNTSNATIIDAWFCDGLRRGFTICHVTNSNFTITPGWLPLEWQQPAHLQHPQRQSRELPWMQTCTCQRSRYFCLTKWLTSLVRISCAIKLLWAQGMLLQIHLPHVHNKALSHEQREVDVDSASNVNFPHNPVPFRRRLFLSPSRRQCRNDLRLQSDDAVMKSHKLLLNQHFKKHSNSTCCSCTSETVTKRSTIRWCARRSTTSRNLRRKGTTLSPRTAYSLMPSLIFLHTTWTWQQKRHMLRHHVPNDSVFIFPVHRLWISPGPTHMLQDLARCALQALQTPHIHCPGPAATLHQEETRTCASAVSWRTPPNVFATISDQGMQLTWHRNLTRMLAVNTYVRQQISAFPALLTSGLVAKRSRSGTKAFLTRNVAAEWSLESQELSNVSLLACVRHDLTQRLSMKAFGFRRE